MEPERVSEKSKPKSKFNKQAQQSKKLQNGAIQTEYPEKESQSVRQYLLALRITICSSNQALEVGNDITKTLKMVKKYPNEAITALCLLYQHHPSHFYSHSKQFKNQQTIRPIFNFIHKEIDFYESYPLMERERVVLINEDFLKWLSSKNEALSKQQLNSIADLGLKVMCLVINGEKDRIIEHMLFLVLKIPMALASQCQNEQEGAFCEGMVKDLMRDITRLLDKNHKISHQISQKIVQFQQQSFKFLVHNVRCPSDIYPLFDLGTLIFTSKNGQACKQMICGTFTYLRSLIDEKKEERDSREKGSIDQRSYEENEMKINAALMAAAFLKFQSVLDTQSLQKKASFIKEVTLLTLLTFKGQLIRMVDELQKLQKSSVPSAAIKGMFEISKFCSNVNHQNSLIPLIKRIQANKDLSAYLSDDKLLPSSPKDAEPIQALAKGMQKVLFQLMCRIQKSLCHYNLQHFMELFIESPLTFRSEYFIEKTFQNQHEEVILKLMRGLAAKWLLTDLKIFDFSFYLLHLVRKCIAEDRMDVLGRFIKDISAAQLSKVNIMAFKMSFEDDNKKYIIPQSNSKAIQLASLTSAGYREKFIFINQIMPGFSQQLIWRQLIAHFFPSQHFILVKSFYNVAHYELANLPNIINDLINIFEQFVNQQQIEDVHATFHLLHCILFHSHHHQHIQQQQKHAKRKCQSKLLQLIIGKSQQILTMYQTVCQRRRTAIGSMSMSNEMMNQNMRCLDRLKRMNAHFLRSVHLWLESLIKMDSLLLIKHSYEQIIETLLSYCKDNQYRQLHQVRYLSHFCSEKYFSNIMSTKVKAKMERKQLLSCHHLMGLKDIINNLMRYYTQEALENDFCIDEKQIINYYDMVLQTPIDAINERELLKSKMIILYQIAQITDFLMNNTQHPFFHFFSHIYHSSIRKTVMQIAIQNPQYVSKYSREFILQLKAVAITQIIKNFQTSFQVIDQEQCYCLIFEMCFDKILQVRFMLINMLGSRFKHDIFKKFLAEKYQIAALLTTTAIFDTNPAIKTTAKRIAEAIKIAGQQCSSLGLVVLLYCVKHLLVMTHRNLIKQQYFTCIDTFLTSFHQLWLGDKEQEYAVYAFASRFIEQARIAFILPSTAIQSFIQTYYIDKQGSDYYLQSEIKEYLKKEQQFSFQFPPDEQVPSFREKLIDNLMYSLPFRVCAKLMQIIQRKPRTHRILRHKKDIFVDWKVLQRNRVVQLMKQKSDRNIVALQS